MPMPISTTLLVLAAILVSIHSMTTLVVALTFGGLALLNEFLRTIVTRAPANEYQIPAMPRERTVRNPLVQDDDAS